MVVVFLYCIWLGKQFRHVTRAHWYSFFFLPTLFLFAAVWSLILNETFFVWKFYLAGLSVGCFTGLFWTRNQRVRVDVKRDDVLVGGSWYLLFCLMTLYCLRCVTQVLTSVYSAPDMALLVKAYGFSIKACVTGLLFGQAFNILYRVACTKAYMSFCFLCTIYQKFTSVKFYEIIRKGNKITEKQKNATLS